MMTPVQQPKICSAENYVPPVIEVIETIEYNEYKTHSGKVLTKEKSSLGGNCVAYARSRADLPQNLWTLADKKKHIKTNTPYKGAVGVTAESSSGHLVIVTSIKGDNLIITEGNWIHGYITTRLVPSSLILGYF